MILAKDSVECSIGTVLARQGRVPMTFSSSLASKNKPDKIIFPVSERGNSLEDFTHKKEF